MHIHVVGIGGTLMAGIALIAKQAGFKVSGCDQALYPPMSTQLAEHGIAVTEGYTLADFNLTPDLFVIGNAARRGMPIIEGLLAQRAPMTSGPAWLAEHVLADKTVIAVAGTHGKTTTSSLIASLLQHADLAPGWLIGGVPLDLSVSAHWSDGPYFVIEADEYDTAFFDKRAKMIHYRPQIAVLNNCEFDHADIYFSLEDMQRQYAHWLKTLPSDGRLLIPDNDPNIEAVLAHGVWTPLLRVGGQGRFQAQALLADAHHFALFEDQQPLGEVSWGLLGEHNLQNALMATAVLRQLDVEAEVIVQGLKRFQGVRRRLEFKGQAQGLTVIEDFAHHPTAIAATLAAYRARIGDDQSLHAVIDFASNTMQAGGHALARLLSATKEADKVWFLNPPAKYNAELPGHIHCYVNQPELLAAMQQIERPAHVLVMSNKDVAPLIEGLLSE